MKIDRRCFLRYLGVTGLVMATGGSVGALLSGCAAENEKTKGLNYKTLDPTNLENFVNPLKLPGKEGMLGILQASAKPLQMTAKQAVQPLVGDKDALLYVYETVGGGASFINPVIKVKQGDTFQATLINQLGEESIVHWHGLHVDWTMDGHPSYAIPQGASYDYHFTVQNRGGTYWYHPHPHEKTAKQAYMGLAGFFVVEDGDDLNLGKSLDLQFGETDVPLVIQDKRLDEKGQPVYQPTDIEKFMGYEGDVIFVNLTTNPVLEVQSRVYRFRLLNGSNARIYRLAFVIGDDKLPYYVIGTDGGLLDKPYQTSEIFVSPGERVDLLLDLSAFNIGDVIALKNLTFDPMHREEGGQGGHGGHGNNDRQAPKLGSGEEFYILKLVLKNRIPYDRKVPQSLSKIEAIDSSAASIRSITLAASGMQWLMNGMTYQMEQFPIVIKKNTTEIWEFKNHPNSMPHPMHLHGFMFQVLKRINSPEQVKKLASDEQGRLLTDLGWKDTVLVWPGETVKIIIDFSHNFTGEQKLLTHCHVLEHEDQGMMLNYLVK